MKRTLLLLGVALFVIVSGGWSPRASGVAADLPAPSPDSSATATGLIVGDADCSGQLGPGDALAIVSGSVCDPDASDADCDGNTGVLDALGVLRQLAALPALSGGACAPGDPLVIGPSTEKLIDDAVTAGDIDADSGLIYKTFAVYGDDRLPAQFVGDRRSPIDHAVLGEAHEALAAMSPADQALLAPFFVPPADEGSWTDRLDGTTSVAQPAGTPAYLVKPGWESVAGQHIRVWYNTMNLWDCPYTCNATVSESLAEGLVATESDIWRLTTLMGRAPLTTGDGLLNVYLARLGPGVFGATTTTGGGCQHQPAYIQIDLTGAGNIGLASDQSGPGLLDGVLAHEFMHAIQFAFSPASCSDYEWWSEATSNYAIQYVYPDSNLEHLNADQYLYTPEYPIEDPSGSYSLGHHPGELRGTDRRDYAAWVFPWFIDFHTGHPDVVRRSWENSESTPDSLKAINDALDGGFKQYWADFQVDNWNHNELLKIGANDNLSDDYSKLDDISWGGYLRRYNVPDVDAKLNGQPSVTYPQIAPIEHLAAENYWYKFTDPAIQSVQFFNEYPSTIDDNVRVQALIKIAGDPQWKKEDWSQDHVHTFCLAEPKEKVEELVIIVSNAEYTDRGQVANPLQSRLTASAAGCTAWEGLITGSVEETASGTDLTFKTPQVRIRYELLPDDEQAPPDLLYKLTSSDPVVWTVTGTQNGCSASGTMEIPPAPGTETQDILPVAGSLTVYPADGTYQADAVGHNSTSTYTIHCDSGDGHVAFPVLNLLLTGFTPTAIKITDSGPRLEGDFTWDLPGYEGKWSWSLRPAP